MAQWAMGASLAEFVGWIRSWLDIEAGLTGLFVMSFLSATLLPGSSEVILVALIAAHPQSAWSAWAVALAGNLLGCVLTFGMGWAASRGYDRFRHVRVEPDGNAARRLRRWGPPALFLSLLPLFGDALVLAAGWLRLPLAASMVWIALGKGARYWAVVLGAKGLLAI